MTKDATENDLFAWADSRPSAVILDANPIITRRIREYVVWLAMNDVDPDAGEQATIHRLEQKRNSA